MIKGSIVALITPFKDNGAVNYDKLKELIDLQLESKTDGLLLLGTTAETPTLSDMECDSIVQLAIEHTKKRIPIIVGVCSNCTKRAVGLAKRYEKMGVDYLLVITPYYNKGNPEGVYRHFEAITNAVETPIILYNIPSRTGYNLSIQEIKRLSLLKRIIGIKEANYDIAHILQVANICGDGFSLFSGNDDLNYLILALGGEGIITVCGNVFPKVMKRLVELTDLGRYDLARGLQQEYSSVVDKLFSETNPIPIKALMNELSMNVGETRLPLAEMDLKKKQELIEAYRKVIGNGNK